MGKTRIMVVEDEWIIALNMSGQLTDMGYDVVATAHSGEEAIDKAQELHPDLILMDIGLPGKMDGIQAAEKIKAIADTPVIYLTAYADEKTLARAKISDPSEYVSKPVRKKQMHDVIELALQKHSINGNPRLNSIPRVEDL